MKTASSQDDAARSGDAGKAILAPDAEQAQRFLTVLSGGEPMPHTFQAFSDRDDLKKLNADGKLIDPNAKWFHDSFDALKLPLTRLNDRGAGVYVMVNKGDGKGRKAENVELVRALFLDTDGAPYPSDLPLEPHIVVQSSPGKWHIYWLVDGVPLEYFAILQRTLAKRYGADPSVCDLPRVMRLPGFNHCKNQPVMVQVLKVSDHPCYTYTEVLEAWPELQGALEAHEQARMLSAARRRDTAVLLPHLDSGRAQQLLQAHHDAVAASPNGQRHDTLKRHARTLGGYVGSGELAYQDALEVLSAAAEVCGLSEGEAADLIRWGLEVGQGEPLNLKRPKYLRASRRERLRSWYL